MMTKKRTFSPESRLEAAQLVVDQGALHLVYLSAYPPELNLIYILWRQMKCACLPLIAYLSFDRLCNEVYRLLGGYGADHTINFE